MTLYVGLVAFCVITITLCFVASLATSSPSDPTRRYCRTCCHRFLRLRDEPEVPPPPPPEVTSSSSHVVIVDEPPSYEQALVMVRASSVLSSGAPVGGSIDAMLEEARLRCDAVESPAVTSTHHLIPDAAAGGSSVTSSISIISASSTPLDGHVANSSPPNYFEVTMLNIDALKPRPH